MPKERITKIYRNSKDKNGIPLVTKDGRPYEKISIKTQEHGSIWLGGFSNKFNDNWKEGDTVDIEINRSPDGRWVNFKTISETQKLWIAIEEIQKELIVLKKFMKDTSKIPDEEDENIPAEEESEDQMDLADIPF